jgi:transposase
MRLACIERSDPRCHGKHGGVLEAGGNILEASFTILLVNAQHVKAVPRRKTDAKECQWIADLLQHRLLKGSFIPPSPIRELRDLTRTRASLRQDHTSVANRMQKILEDAK